MAIGYACLTVGVEGTKFRTCRKDRATPERLEGLIQENLRSLNRILDYNIENNIRLFRITSDIIPFGSHPVNNLKWQEIFSDELAGMGKKATNAGMRLSMHPGQYTVLNSKDPEVAERAVEDLRYHTAFLDALGLDRTHKIILHIGGAYGNKRSATERFKERYRMLEDNIKARLVIENDDKIYNIREVLDIGKELGVPVVYDNLHNQVNPYNDKPDEYWIEMAAETWREEDGPQKVHYSQQDEDKKPGSHSETINLEKFLGYYRRVGGEDLDIMLEVKDKNLSAVKCILGTEPGHIRGLEREWARYKYLVLEHSPRIYQEIRELLKDKSSYPAVEFYRLIDEALATEVTPGHEINAGEHIWGYFKNDGEEKERKKFEKNLEKIKGGGSALPMKRQLFKGARKREEDYLLESLYFKDLL